MAGEVCLERKRKRLIVHEKVEVRSVEEGFLGSWHSGTVIACENKARRVQYDHLLCDDSSQNLTERINVHPVFDKVIPEEGRATSHYRGLIRPLPPPFDFDKWSLSYGECVDVYYRDAWWEGVIFDHDDGSEDRKVFFPDMGDEMRCGMDALRIALDWDEFTEKWKPRGSWLFLELIEEFEQDWPLQVSVRQIWYEVRGKKGFLELGDWTSNDRDLWTNLVREVIFDNTRLTLNQIFQEFDLSGDLVEEALSTFYPFHVILKPEVDLGNSLAVLPVENDGLDSRLLPTELGNAPAEEINLYDFVSNVEDERLMNILTGSNTPFDGETPVVPPFASSILPSNTDEFSWLNSNVNSEGFSNPSSKAQSVKFKHPRPKTCRLWLPADNDIVPGPEFCPDAINEYLGVSNPEEGSSKNSKLEKVRKHLAHLGWKIEFTRHDGRHRMRYTSPDGKSYNSLQKVCEDLREPSLEILPLASQDDKRFSAAMSDAPFSSSPLVEQAQSCMKVSVMPSPSDAVFESEYCPDAVLDYCFLGSVEFKDNRRWRANPQAKQMQIKARKHLSAVGWSFSYTKKRGKLYISPKGKLYHSLQGACKGCIEEDGVYDSNAFTYSPRQNMNASEEARGQLASERLSSTLMNVVSHDNSILLGALSKNWLTESTGIPSSRELVESSKANIEVFKQQQSKRTSSFPPLGSQILQKKYQNTGFRKTNKRKEFGSIIKLRDDLGSDYATSVQRSRKRARKVALSSSSYQNPRTILSWLIDNNVVLPRAKVLYLDRKDRHPLAEGRITRDGIKCICCQKVFNLSEFQAHAGGTYLRPAADIFLEDGRSLLDCQSQLRRQNSLRKLMREKHEMKGGRHYNKNDSICSVCYFGGQLVLCDQCPSSFHITCLDLKDVPDGDWFCPSCCCGICGQSRFNRNTEQLMDNSVLICDQCERQYHAGCLRKRGDTDIHHYPEGNWFCNKRCKQIYMGLHKLLGKSVRVGNDSLNWTLLKNPKYDDDHDSSDMEALTENYSKLNVALTVMHECFEHVKEPRTGRDLVEDVIFGRWSELNHLNFRGFYTVLLESNDELIAVAIIRVHGEKAAEVPLVCTRFQYRRLGMCRLLMNELEKKLKELGVERLVLPAVPGVLNTWITSFGFSEMTALERLNFLDYTFLNFQGAVMCQKLLMEIPTAEPSQLIRASQNMPRGDLDGNSTNSEVFEPEQVEKSEIVDQGSAHTAVVDGTDGANGAAPLAILVNQPPLENGDSLECSVDGAGHEECKNSGDGLFKCYKRRRISAC